MEQGEREEIIDGLAQDVIENPPETEGQEEVVRGLAEAELTGRIRNAAETYNLAEKLDSQLLQNIGRQVWEGFKSDDESRTNWLEKNAFWLALYMQQDYAENADPERSWGATESIPILTEACDQFQSRTYKIFFPNDTFVSAIPMRRTVQDREVLEERAERIGRHMSYQLGFEDRSYKQDKDALFLGVAVHGSFFTKTYFSEKERKFKVDNVRPTDLVVNYNVGPCRLEDLRRKTHIIYTTVGETEQMHKEGFFIEAARPARMEINAEYNTKVDEVSGLSAPEGRGKDHLAVLLEQHCYLDLDEGRLLPYVVTICGASHKILRLTIGWAADEEGQPTDDYKQVQYFTHYKFKENPDGFYGLGLGHSIGDLNSACNIMLRQSIDGATLANDGNMSGFVSEKLGLEGDEIALTLGKLRKIPDTVGDMNNSIMLMKFPGPNAALIQLMGQMDQRAQRLGSVTEATTGTIDKVLQPTTQLSLIEQSLEQFSSVQMRLANSLSQELQKIFRINQRYLPFIDYFVVNGTPEVVTRSDYKDDMLIEPVFDPKYATQSQKVSRAQAELQATMQNPVNQGRPQVYDEAFKRYLKALEVEDIEALIPPQPEPENFDDQLVENMFFLQPKEARPLFDVFPDQNHEDHLVKLAEFTTQFGESLLPDQLEDIIKHKMKHESYLYGQQQGIIPTRQIPTPPLDGRSDVSMANGQAGVPVPSNSSPFLGEIMGGLQGVGGGAEGNA